jgi:hypothetical protein
MLGEVSNELKVLFLEPGHYGGVSVPHQQPTGFMLQRCD